MDNEAQAGAIVKETVNLVTQGMSQQKKTEEKATHSAGKAVSNSSPVKDAREKLEHEAADKVKSAAKSVADRVEQFAQDYSIKFRKKEAPAKEDPSKDKGDTNYWEAQKEAEKSQIMGGIKPYLHHDMGVSLREEAKAQQEAAAKAQQEAAKAQQETAKAQQEIAKAQQETAKAQQETAKAQQEIAKAQQEEAKAQQEAAKEKQPAQNQQPTQDQKRPAQNQQPTQDQKQPVQGQQPSQGRQQPSQGQQQPGRQPVQAPTQGQRPVNGRETSRIPTDGIPGGAQSDSKAPMAPSTGPDKVKKPSLDQHVPTHGPLNKHKQPDLLKSPLKKMLNGNIGQPSIGTENPFRDTMQSKVPAGPANNSTVKETVQKTTSTAAKGAEAAGKTATVAAAPAAPVVAGAKIAVVGAKVATTGAKALAGAASPVSLRSVGTKALKNLIQSNGQGDKEKKPVISAKDAGKEIAKNVLTK